MSNARKPARMRVALDGRAADAPRGIWYAQTDGTGGLLRDADGNVVRVRPPLRPPSRPLGR